MHAGKQYLRSCLKTYLQRQQLRIGLTPQTIYRTLHLSSLLVAFPLYADTHYVNVNNSSPRSPYTNWAMAATVIQDARKRVPDLAERLCLCFGTRFHALVDSKKFGAYEFRFKGKFNVLFEGGIK